MPADAVDFKWYRYTDDGGDTWAVKQDKTWGDNADADFAAFNTADPPMVKSAALRPRTILLQDTTSTRQTTRVVGTLTADAWVNNPYTTTVKFRGLAAGVVATKISQRGEHIRRARAINSKPEPA